MRYQLFKPDGDLFDGAGVAGVTMGRHAVSSGAIHVSSAGSCEPAILAQCWKVVPGSTWRLGSMPGIECG